jgi:hypothetical protein
MGYLPTATYGLWVEYGRFGAPKKRPAMSAFGGKADIQPIRCDVRF